MDIILQLVPFIALLLGVLIGHYLTLRSFAYVQPSVKEMNKMSPVVASTEADPWADNPQETDDKAHTKFMDEQFEATGLPPELKDKFIKKWTEDSQGPGEMISPDHIIEQLERDYANE